MIGGFTPRLVRENILVHCCHLYAYMTRRGDLIYTGRAGGGFDDRDLAETQKKLKPLVTSKCPFKDVPAEVKKSTWVEPKLVCDVQFAEWTPDRLCECLFFRLSGRTSLPKNV